ncbi:carbonic anhydrase [Gordonia sp. 'Campus']|uniref:carbonic anhydrase n=1 Tax=Gordonia sp. 'Campus' TaxID=2915824 RepID=UPI001EE41424|nr:carbonic anhydrase [Gordonia sp. 'Campus']
MTATTPRAAWRILRDGNDRFVTGESQHPSQGIEDRARLADGQHPHVVLFGCADSRLSAEIIFDQGLGDMFVVRTAGHVIDSAVMGSLEYAVEVLEVPLIVILGHDSCGAVKATLDALDDLQIPGGYIRDVVERVAPSILAGRREGLSRVDEFEARHVVETGQLLMQRSRVIADRISTGRLAIVGLTYQLHEGKVSVQGVYGDIGERPAPTAITVESA